MVDECLESFDSGSCTGFGPDEGAETGRGRGPCWVGDGFADGRGQPIGGEATLVEGRGATPWPHMRRPQKG